MNNESVAFPQVVVGQSDSSSTLVMVFQIQLPDWMEHDLEPQRC